MAKITKEETRVLDLDEAITLAKYAEGRVRYSMHIRAFLPTEEGRGFEGSACVNLSRAAFIKALEDMGRVLCRKRGAKVRLNLTPADREGGLVFINCY